MFAIRFDVYAGIALGPAVAVVVAHPRDRRRFAGDHRCEAKSRGRPRSTSQRCPRSNC